LNQAPRAVPVLATSRSTSPANFVLVANYDGGSVATFPVNAGGTLGEAADFVEHHGSSADKERQTAPHAHWIATLPTIVLPLLADLGLMRS